MEEEAQAYGMSEVKASKYGQAEEGADDEEKEVEEEGEPEDECKYIM